MSETVPDHSTRRYPGRRANHPRGGGIGPYSKPIDRGALGAKLSGRSREGRFLRAFERQLLDHLGHEPNTIERALIARASRVALHLELMDERSFVDGHRFGIHDHNYYVAWSNSFARLLGQLGMKTPKTRSAAASGDGDALAALRNHVANRGEAA
jgi:hypothetical protein